MLLVSMVVEYDATKSTSISSPLSAPNAEHKTTAAMPL